MKINDELIIEIQDNYDNNPSQDAQVFILLSFVLLIIRLIIRWLQPKN